MIIIANDLRSPIVSNLIRFSVFISCLHRSSLSYSCPMSVPNTILQKPSTIYNEYVLEQSNSKRFFNKYVAGITFRDNVKKGTGPISVDGWYSNQVRRVFLCKCLSSDRLLLLGSVHCLGTT